MAGPAELSNHVVQRAIGRIRWCSRRAIWRRVRRAAAGRRDGSARAVDCGHASLGARAEPGSSDIREHWRMRGSRRGPTAYSPAPQR
jgi:hypothetical protein